MVSVSFRKINTAFSRMTKLIVAALLSILVNSSSVGTMRLLAQDQNSEPNFGAECGTYSLAAAASAAGIKLDDLSIVDGDYVSHQSGSSEADLVRAADDHGFSATVLRAISESYLRRSAYPIVLNLNYEPSSSSPGHWVAFLGDDQGRAVIFDVARKKRVSSIPYGDLLTEMTGEGILVTSVQLGLLERVIDRLGGLGQLWPLILLLLLPLSFRRLRSVGPLFQIVVILGFTIVWAGTVFFVSPSSFLKNRGAVVWIQAKYFAEDSLPNVSLGQLASFLQRADVVVIDSRTATQFEYGHIPGAINLSIDLKPEEFIEATSLIDKSNTVVVYCNDSHCNWSRIVATRLKGAGFTHVRVFEAGLAEYLRQREQKPLACGRNLNKRRFAGKDRLFHMI